MRYSSEVCAELLLLLLLLHTAAVACCLITHSGIEEEKKQRKKITQSVAHKGQRGREKTGTPLTPIGYPGIPSLEM